VITDHRSEIFKLDDWEAIADMLQLPRIILDVQSLFYPYALRRRSLELEPDSLDGRKPDLLGHIGADTYYKSTKPSRTTQTRGSQVLSGSCILVTQLLNSRRRQMSRIRAYSTRYSRFIMRKIIPPTKSHSYGRCSLQVLATRENGKLGE
jgi:hypothetical protein